MGKDLCKNSSYLQRILRTVVVNRQLWVSYFLGTLWDGRQLNIVVLQSCLLGLLKQWQTRGQTNKWLQNTKISIEDHICLQQDVCFLICIVIPSFKMEINLENYYLFVVCAYMCAHMCANVYMYMFIHIWHVHGGQRSTLGWPCLPHLFFILFLRQDLSLVLNSPSRTGWVASKHQQSSPALELQMLGFYMDSRE